MNITVRAYIEQDINEMIQIWNEVVEEGNSFPREEVLTGDEGGTLFASQAYVGVATDSETNEIYGLYVLHPNGVGRGSHICNTCYAVREGRKDTTRIPIERWTF
jgi:hypothetical protein